MDNKEIANLRRVHNEIMEVEDKTTDAYEKNRLMIVRMKIRSKISTIMKNENKTNNSRPI